MTASKQGGPKSKHRSDNWKLLARLLTIAGGIAGLMAGAVWAYVAPKKFESIAVVQESPAAMDITSGPQGTSPNNNSQFLGSEFNFITALDSFETVADRLDLAVRWNLPRDQIVDILAGIVETEQIRRTDLIEIRVRHTNARDTRDIADAVAEAYADRRRKAEMNEQEELSRRWMTSCGTRKIW
jgi:uncharacterized protein involved in exopolysaccharide biosynthesis